MQKINEKYDLLQLQYGSQDLNSVYGYGCQTDTEVALVFMNPTKRNIATAKDWIGLRAQWLGTKQIWEFLWKCGLFSQEMLLKIKEKAPKDWTPSFCEEVYDEVKRNKMWITNLGKCSQDDARPLPDEVFIQYRDLLKQELALVKPRKIFFFGNQVASIMLEQPITVSTARQQCFHLNIDGEIYDCYAIYYPVGNGRFNQPKAIEDIKEILQMKDIK